jgi:hypothetical protein
LVLRRVPLASFASAERASECLSPITAPTHHSGWACPVEKHRIRSPACHGLR